VWCLSGNKRRLVTRAAVARGSLGIYLCGRHGSASFRSRTPGPGRKGPLTVFRMFLVDSVGLLSLLTFPFPDKGTITVRRRKMGKDRDELRKLRRETNAHTCSPLGRGGL
jgi:hypothetical protein